MLIHSDPNNMNYIVYHLIIVRYSMKTLHWYFPWATALHLYNMTGRGGKLQQLHCYHPFSDSLDIYLTKNHYENYSPKMVPIAKIWGPGSWTISTRSISANSVRKTCHCGCAWLHMTADDCTKGRYDWWFGSVMLLWHQTLVNSLSESDA